MLRDVHFVRGAWLPRSPRVVSNTTLMHLGHYALLVLQCRETDSKLILGGLFTTDSDVIDSAWIEPIHATLI